MSIILDIVWRVKYTCKGDMFVKEFGVFLKENRTKQNLSLVKLSRLTGLPATTIHNYERGSEPSLDKADKLLKALGITYTLGAGLDDATSL